MSTEQKKMQIRLHHLMKVQSVTGNTGKMIDYIINRAKEIPDITGIRVDDGNIYITKGIADSYPCVIAHTDTVHNIVNDFEVFTRRGIMFAMDFENCVQTGIGGDDKVGIFVALEALRKTDAIKVAFFRDEETGCEGSKVADMDFFNNVEFVLQCDRRGYRDFVRGIFGATLFDDDFSEAISATLEAFSKAETFDGGLTDVYQLYDNGLKVCMANISCGYYAPHTENEFIDIDEVFLTVDLVLDLINLLKGQIWINSEYQKYKKYSWLDDFYFDDEPQIIKYEDMGQLCPKCNGEDTYFDQYEQAIYCFDCQDYKTAILPHN